MPEIWARLTRHRGTKATALFIAILAWFWVQSQEVDDARIRVHLQWILHEGAVSVAPLPTTATVEVVGPRAAIRRAQRGEPTLLIDLSRESLGVNEIHLDTYQTEGFPVGLARRRWRPDVVSVRLDEEVVRNVPVVASWIGDPAREHAVEHVHVVPDVVRISGPRVVLEPLHEIHTMAIDVTGWDSTRTVEPRLDLPRIVTVVGGWNGTAEVEIASLLSTRTMVAVPVVVLGNRGWHAPEDQGHISIDLRGPTAVLRALEADHVFAAVRLPEATHARRVEARLGASEGPSYEIILPRPDVVAVIKAPPKVVVEAQ